MEVAGGTNLWRPQGGQEISRFRPGLVSKDSEGKLTCQPIYSRIVSLFMEQNDLMYAVPGASSGGAPRWTLPCLQSGQDGGPGAGAVGHLPNITLSSRSPTTSRRLLGVRTEGDKKAAKGPEAGQGEVLMVNIGSYTSEAGSGRQG